MSTTSRIRPALLAAVLLAVSLPGAARADVAHGTGNSVPAAPAAGTTGSPWLEPFAWRGLRDRARDRLRAQGARERSTDALRACGATDNGNGTAWVPPNVRQSYYGHVPSEKEPVAILCGDGVWWGAVHIEVKHNVPNWATAIGCIVKVLDYGEPLAPNDQEEGKFKVQLVNGPQSALVVIGVQAGDLITAYTNDGQQDTWELCSSVW